jgi:hypothetical protein
MSKRQYLVLNDFQEVVGGVQDTLTKAKQMITEECSEGEIYKIYEIKAILEAEVEEVQEIKVKYTNL